VRYVSAQLRQKVPTAILNRTLNDAIERRQPVSDMGHRLKFYYATQVQQAPPTFLLFVNRDELFGATYLKYLQGELRAAFGYEGCPIILAPKPRPKTIDPVRKYKKHPFADKGAAASAPVGGRAGRSSGPRPGGPGPRRDGPPRRPGEKSAARPGSRPDSRPESRPGSRPGPSKSPQGRATARPGRRPAPVAGRGGRGKAKGGRGGPGSSRRR